MITYFVIGFVVLFFTYKILNPKLIEKKGNYYSPIEHKEYWMIVFIPFFWPITIPAIIGWRLLERITSKIFK